MSPLAQGLSLIFFVLAIGGALIYTMLVITSSHRLIIRDPLNNKAYITQYFIKEKKDPDSGVMNWVSVRGSRVLKTPRPPAEAIQIGKRGKKFAEAYRISEDEFIWIQDKGIKLVEEVDKDGNKKLVAKDLQEDGTETIIDSFKPFSPVQREVIVTQYRKAQEKRNKRWTADKIVAMSSIGGFVLLLIMLMIFWGDLAQPILDMDNRIASREQRLYEREQQLCAAVTGNTVQTFEPQQGGTAIIQQGENPPTKQ